MEINIWDIKFGIYEKYESYYWLLLSSPILCVCIFKSISRNSSPVVLLSGKLRKVMYLVGIIPLFLLNLDYGLYFMLISESTSLGLIVNFIVWNAVWIFNYAIYLKVFTQRRFNCCDWCWTFILFATATFQSVNSYFVVEKCGIIVGMCILYDISIFIFLACSHIGRLYPTIHEYSELMHEEGTQTYESLGICSRIFFIWTSRLFSFSPESLSSSDDWKNSLPYPVELNIERISNKVDSYLQTIPNIATRFQFLKFIQSIVGWKCAMYFIFLLISEAMALLQTVVLKQMFVLIESGTIKLESYLIFVTALTLASFFRIISSIHFQFLIGKAQTVFSAALIALIHGKILCTKAYSLKKSSFGKILNMITSDVNQITNLIVCCHHILVIILSIAMSLIILYHQIGSSFLAGMTFSLLMLPLNHFIAMRMGLITKRHLAQRDKKIKFAREVVCSMFFVKATGIEEICKNLIGNLRRKELKLLKQKKYLDAICVVFWATTPSIISLITVLTSIASGQGINVSKIFTSISVFNLMLGPLNSLAWIYQGIAQSFVSEKRIRETFMVSDDENDFSLNSNSSLGVANQVVANDILYSLNKCAFSWSRTDDPILKSVTLDIKKGCSLGIIGDVGSGKTTFIMGMMREAILESGLILSGSQEISIGYYPQNPHIFNATVRENIVLDREFDQIRYNAVIEACALDEDIASFENGDMTLILHDGTNLSGGQKARICLASVIYEERDLYLLDDPISSVDILVAKHIINNCIFGILKDKTKILVTHRSSLLQEFDQIYCIKNSSMYLVHRNVRIDVTEADKEIDNPIVTTSEMEQTVDPIDFVSNQGTEVPNEAESLDNSNIPSVADDITTSDYVGMEFYVKYSKEIGWGMLAVIITSLALLQGSKNGADWWLSFWLIHQNDKKIPIITGASIYTEIVVFCVVIAIVRGLSFADGTLLSAQSIHDRLIDGIMNAPFDVIQSTSTGSMINKFTSDMVVIDENLPFMLNIFFAEIFTSMGLLISVSFSAPVAILCFVCSIPWILYIQKRYRTVSSTIKRYSSACLSPLYDHISNNLHSSVYLRCNKLEKFVFKSFATLLSNVTMSNFYYFSACQWLSIKLKLVSSIYVFIILSFGFISLRVIQLDSVFVILGIMYSLSVYEKLAYTVQTFIETDMNMVNTERIERFLSQLPQNQEEPILRDQDFDQSTMSNHPPELVFSNVEFCYKNENHVFVHNGLNISISHPQMVGICGRTGSGKSTIFKLLFRLFSPKSGWILYKNVPIETISPECFHSTFFLITQDPVVFSLSVRMNLTLGKKYDDSELWKVLEKCRLADIVSSHLSGLDSIVDADLNLSFGQKQMLCVARALLRKPEVLALDEPTSSMDSESEMIMKEVIQSEFRESIVLWIAHRVNLFQGFHRIIIIHDGAIVESGDPNELLSNSQSLYSKIQSNDSLFSG